MTGDAERIREDLEYVRTAVAGSRRTPVSPAGIFYLWAGLVAAGFAMVDLAVEWVGLYWLVAGPAGFLASAYLGWRGARRRGELHPGVADKHLLHWAGLMGVVLLSLVGVHTGAVSWDGFGATILLFSALAYYLAGVHAEGRFLWLGVLMAAGYLAVLLVPGPTWTAVGLFVGVALVAGGLTAARQERRGAEAG